MPGGSIDEQTRALQDFDSYQTQFMTPLSVTSSEAGGARSKKLKWTKPLAPNVEYIHAIDAQMQGGTDKLLSLRDFFTHADAWRLQDGESRYYVDAAELPAALATDLGCLTRSCIESSTSETRLEVSWTERRLVLHTVGDQGSIGGPARAYLFQSGIRGADWYEVLHRRCNYFERDLKLTGAFSMRLETSLVMSIRKGPFQGCANFMKLQFTATWYFRSRNESDTMFAFLYDEICDNWWPNKSIPTRGSRAHMKEVWLMCQTCPYFHKTGSIIKRSRFFDWCHNVGELAEWMPVLKLVLIVYGMKNNYYNNIYDTPMFLNRYVDEDGRDDCVEEIGDDDAPMPAEKVSKPRSAAEYKKEFDEQKKKNQVEHASLL